MISKKEVKHIASLARIGLSEEEVDKYTQDLSAVLDWVDELKKVDVAGVEPISNITGMENIKREDKAEIFGNKEEILKNAPETKEGFVKVKSVL